MQSLLSDYSASISELKKNPTALLNESEGSPIVILNHNTPTAYLISADSYENMMNYIEDLELIQIHKERIKEKSQAIKVTLDEL
ncbi:type II toxin-antitoxin system Phd/YefM family antitoxin [Lentisphaera profundi]|uniref:Antitoxin n=1 Tax=Lentisphaera profundi TaxID=1658616 RepID=A0ABY7VUX8_9BACT|nr:type II toxin-antitoxin system Phd/YefM family antitoxin [Lentisphaera profundi]WDE97696.1 type II toxin-antitoxin system Phd/YefM family antitoxin [Lentisphaera profundi]